MRRIFLFATWLCAMGAHAEPLTLLTEEYPPFNMTDGGKLVGISTDIVQELMRTAKVAFTLRASPWMRAITLAHSEPGHCVFSMSRLADRENQYRWVGPIAFNDWYLFAKADGVHRPQSLADTKGMRVGSYLGDGGVDYLKQRGVDVDVVPNDDLNPRKLQLGRIDYWASGKLSGQYRLKTQGISGIEPVLKLERGDMYLACHPDTPTELVDTLNRTLADMAKRGVITRIYARYGYTP